MEATVTPDTACRINRDGMKPCCQGSLNKELYRRKDTGEGLMVNGDTLKCGVCNSEMVCETGESGKLRWGMVKTAGSETAS